MPLRDHFRPPLDNRTSWEGFYGAWPALIVMDLNRRLPDRYVAAPRIRISPFEDIDGADDDLEEPGAEGGVATAVWTPPQPTFAVVTDPPDQVEYEVRVYDMKRKRRLVATVEIVSPGNTDRPENRRAFVTKCGALLRQRVSVAIVDLVTTRQFNLYNDLLEAIDQTDPALGPEPPWLYAAASRWTHRDDAWHLETWAHRLALGQSLSTLPLWLAENFSVPLELETTYEETCRIFRLA